MATTYPVPLSMTTAGKSMVYLIICLGYYYRPIISSGHMNRLANEVAVRFFKTLKSTVLVYDF